MEASQEDRSAYLAALGFPLLVIAGGALGYLAPAAVEPISGWTTWLLGIVMFGMGLTLRPADFALVARRPLPVLIGVVAQFVIMSALAVVVTLLLRLPPEVAAGVILVGCAPGGTSSNVVSYLARGDVALSVTMTSISTLLAPLVIPVLTLWLAGEYMPVSASSMALSILRMVFLPVVAGLLLRLVVPKAIEAVLPALPWVSVVAISLIVAIVVFGSRDKIVQAGLIVLAAVVIHNALGYALGYATGRLSRQPEPVARTMAIEVGMQNSGLAATLAGAYLSPLAALPGAVFSVWHNLSGALLVLIARRVDYSHD
ncbi:bile acid:sodium symporter family protein [Corynebacterium liangguodongii]|uniref:Bile acid:sodium symporter n=1 Tax=Corynebacterium liangguodongii TaxID=2079535 RepID=A0A2S0WDN0_9CORY|nr:bile acid:sodium symporter family protein [Corynebacterium liangguodongii]AWB83860.1 Bile acid:sodium symporter [Corynebacterium liangguodongii]PWB98980.1 bile acid:sodium symporter family protein [Corynebacterium liangguodongii]